MNILWVDDDWATERERQLKQTKQEITDCLEASISSVNWITTSNPAEAKEYLLHKGISIEFAIVDLIFSNIQQMELAVNAGEFLRELEKKRVHYAIYSNCAEDFSDRVDKNFCIGLFGKSKTDEISLVEKIKDFLYLPPVRILQMSDLHYNSEDPPRNRDDFFKALGEAISDLNNQKPFDIITIVGDIVAKKPAQELHKVSSVIKDLFTKSKIDTQKLFIVPGNHEVIWSDFVNQTRSLDPYSGYVTVLKALFKNQILKTYKGYRNKELPDSISADGITWHRKIDSPNISIVGICSNADEQGVGIISDSNIDFIKEKWVKVSKKPNELRMLMLHHNVFPVQSFNSLDENRTIRNAGTALELLTQSNCDIVFSGHTHRPEIVLYQSSSLSPIGDYDKNKTIIFISSGPCGGTPSTGDFSKSFNVIELSYDLRVKRIKVLIIPFQYSSYAVTWSKRKEVTYFL